jgi:hypothetical protein
MYTLDLLKSGATALMYARLLDLTCSTQPQSMYIFLDETMISSNENSSVKITLQMT